MFNSPLLGIAIGLVFIFLLYSLLVTSINETIAMFFSLREKMLNSSIVEGMLSDKRVKLRGSGKKEDAGGTAAINPAIAPVPVSVNLHTQPAGEEAVG